MALLNFTPVNLGSTVKTGKAYDEEFVQQYQDIWTYLEQNPGQGVTVDYGTSEKREEWFKNAKAYGAGMDEPLNIRRIKGTDSMGDHGQMTFVIERASDKEERKQAVKDAAERTSKVRAWAKEQGLQVSEKGKLAKSVYEAYDIAH